MNHIMLIWTCDCKLCKRHRMTRDTAQKYSIISNGPPGTTGAVSKCTTYQVKHVNTPRTCTYGAHMLGDGNTVSTSILCWIDNNTSTSTSTTSTSTSTSTTPTKSVRLRDGKIKIVVTDVIGAAKLTSIL
jgi:hypothetical protein